MPHLDAFRDEIVAWFGENAPHDWRATVSGLSDDENLAFQRSWLRLLNQKGLGAPGVPVEWGGGGYDVRQQVVIYEEWARAGAPPPPALYSISLNHIPETLLAHGTDAQRALYIRDAIDGVVWCQGFSEPGAGSDLAAIRTTAVLDGDEWVINGQKIWSSNAAHAEHCILLARTGTVESRNRGITFFIMDMAAPGVEVRPIRQNTGQEEFNEIFLDNVRIPADHVVGDVGGGWLVTQATLAAERGPIGMSVIGEIREGLTYFRAEVDARYGDSVDGDRLRDQLAILTARLHAVSALAMDVVDQLDRGGQDGGLASLMKISFSDLLRDLTDLANVTSVESLVDPEQPHALGYVSHDWAIDWLQSWAWSIAGGTNEIQRNIIAERTLGLPREPRAATKGSS